MRGLTALIAGVTCVVAGRLPAQPTASRLTPQEVVVVRPLFFIPQPGGTPTGACLGARLVIGGAPPGWVRIGVYEPDVGGTTDVWRATAWSAALVAAQLTGFDSRALQMSIEVARSTDGPSAGALLTVAIVSAIRGDALRDGVTMTGTINPDGTIGPVSGIPLKLDGAARAGQKLVLIPAGEDSEIDPRTNQTVNLVQYGKHVGVEVRPMKDIWQAYAEFTGVALPRPQAKAIPQPSPEFQRLLSSRVERWFKLSRSAREKYTSWPAFAHTSGLDQQMQSAWDRIGEAQGLLQQGDSLAAYMTAFAATLDAWMAHEMGRYIYQVSSGSVAGWNRLPEQNEWLLKELELTTQAMRAFRPRTFDQMAMYLNAGQAYSTALSLHETAEDLKWLHGSQYMKLALGQVESVGANSADQLRQAVFSLFAGAFQIAAWLECKLATDYLELAAQLEGTPLPPLPDIVRVAEHYRRGAQANLELVDKLALQVECAKQEMPFEVLRRIMPIADPYYGVARAGLTRVLPALPTYLGEGEQLEYVRLATAMYLHSVTAALIGKHYSIGVEMGDDFLFKRVLREQALQDWIDESRQRTEGSIQALMDQGVDASTCIAGYWMARNAEKKTKPHERFEALQSYFQANLMAQLLGQLARSEAATPAALPVAPGAAPVPEPPQSPDAVQPPTDAPAVPPPVAPPRVQ